MNLIQAIVNNAICAGSATHAEAAEIRGYRINVLLPSGSGFDAGTSIEHVSDKKVVLATSFHHMNENGFYDGWTEHKVTVTPAFIGEIEIKISGRNRNEIKDYIGDVFREVLLSNFEWVNPAE